MYELGNLKGVRNLPPTPKGKASKNIQDLRSNGSSKGNDFRKGLYNVAYAPAPGTRL